MIVASFSPTDQAGLHVYQMDAQTGQLTHVRHVTEGIHRPLYTTTNPTQQYLYVADLVPKQNDAIAAYAINAKTGDLQFLNSKPSGGKVPCYVNISPDHHAALVANYSNGTVSLLNLESDGKIGQTLVTQEHQGHSVHPKRQKTSHPHSFQFSPDGRFALAADLGTDRIVIYRVNAKNNTLQPNDPPYFTTPPGSGPRHLVFDSTGTQAFATTELDNTILSMRYDPQAGTLKLIEVISMLPQGTTADSYAADLHIHPNGKFLYASNRGTDNIVIMSIDPASGKLEVVGHEPTQGSFPRGFAIEPTGRFLYVANERSDNVVVFKIDPQTGKLSPTGQTVELDAPMCITFIPIKP